MRRRRKRRMEDPGYYNLTFSQLSLRRLPSFVIERYPKDGEVVSFVEI
jgi:hypothetical protein